MKNLLDILSLNLESVLLWAVNEDDLLIDVGLY